MSIEDSPHRLSEIDSSSRVATCSVCGPGVQIFIRDHKNGTTRWRCQARQAERNQRERAKVAVGTQRRRVRADETGGRTRYVRGIGRVTANEFNARLESQGGGCAICGGQSWAGQNLAIDHCHQTGLVRGLLCAGCNTALGLMRDNPSRLRSAADYLERAG